MRTERYDMTSGQAFVTWTAHNRGRPNKFYALSQDTSYKNGESLPYSLPYSVKTVSRFEIIWLNSAMTLKL